MSSSHHPATFAPLTQLISATAKATPTLLVFAIIVGGWLIIHRVQSVASQSDVEMVEPETSPQLRLSLPAGKLAAAKLKSEPVTSRTIQHLHTVPGRLRYDQTQHIDIKAPLDGILSEVLVKPGDEVAAGDLIAVIQSPEVGQARAAILARQKDLELVRLRMQREQALATNVQRLVEQLDQHKPLADMQSEFASYNLGAYRQEILSAYERMTLAETLVEKIRPIVDSGAVSGRTLRERESEWQLAETAFRTVRDQALLSVQQANLKAESEYLEADRQYKLATQDLDSLLGYQATPAAAEPPFTATLQPAQFVSLDTTTLSRLEVRAPFQGTIESQSFARNERLSRGDAIMVLANCDALSVEASLRENDWAALALATGQEISVTVPALAHEPFNATIRYVGRELQAQTNSVPLIANIANHERILRPGMFARVTLPIGDSRTALTIAPEAVIRHEDRPFVFIDEGVDGYRPVPVRTGQEAEDWIEITEGVQPGQLVVTHGSFLLKSEWLLQGEGE